MKSIRELAEFLTDKASVEIPSSIAGTVQSLKAKPGDIIQVGHVLMTIKQASASKKANQETTEPQVQPPITESPPPQPAKGPEVIPPVAETHVLATPATRRLARQLGVDINQVQGTGNIGRITRDDVKSFATQVQNHVCSNSSSCVKR